VPAASGAAGGAGRIRASDADRDRALDVLAAAFAEGRITAEEHAERIGHVYNLRSQADLAELTGDLPAAATCRRFVRLLLAAYPRSTLCMIGWGTRPWR
jgi:hypothetical protein